MAGQKRRFRAMWVACAGILAALGPDWPASLAQEKPAAESTEAAAAAASNAELEKILERLERVERELLQLRIKSGKVPEEKANQRVIALIETAQLASIYYGNNTNPRYLALRVMIVNLSGQPVTLKRDEVRLAADGANFTPKDAPQQMQFYSFQVGQQSVQLRSAQMPPEVTVGAGGHAATWMLFPDLPPGSHVPQMTLTMNIAGMGRQIDINASQRDLLRIKAQRLGPRKALGKITIEGAMNSVNVGALIDELDRFSAEKVVRVVIDFKETATLADYQIHNWLQNGANAAGRNAQVNEMQFPAFPASIRELHLAALPAPNQPAGPSQKDLLPIFPGGGAGQRIHRNEVEAVMAALRTAFETLPRDELLQAIQNGSPVERGAALAAGAGRLPPSELPFVLKATEDDNPVIQQAALAALAHFGEPAAIDMLVAWARKNVEPQSSTALASLAGSRYAAAHDALLALLNNEPPESKKAIVRILGAFPRPIWSEAIYEFVKDPRSGLNVEALLALVQVGHPKLVSVLSDALASTDENLRNQALQVLVNRTDQQSEQIALRHTLEHIAAKEPAPVMLQLLNRVKDRRAIPLLIARFADSSNKAGLIQTLALIGDQETATFLLEKYNSLQSNEKGEALRALARLNKPKYRELALAALVSGDASLVGYAVQGLQEDGGPEAIRAMIEALDKAGNANSWSQLMYALANTGTAAARAALRKARDSDNQDKRNIAVSALQNMRYRSPGYQYYAQAQNLSREKKWKEAAEQFGMALQLDPDFSDAYAERGHAFLHQQKLEEAGKDFARGFELDPYNSLALTGVCLVLILKDGKHAEGVQKLEEHRAKYPNNAMFLYNAACVYGRAHAQVMKDEALADRDALRSKYSQAGLADLKKSLEFGFQDFELMKKDPDLDSFRDLPEFKDLLSNPPPPPAPQGGRGRARAARQLIAR